MIQGARKYWYFVVLHWQEAFMYRGEMFLWMFIDAFPLLAMLLLWLSVYRHGDQVAGFSLGGIITYYVVGSLFSRLAECHFEEEVVRQVNTGDIARFFLRPMKIKFYWITGEIGWKLMGFILTTGPIIALLWFLKPEWLQFHSWYQFLVIITFGLLGFIIEACLSLIIAAGAFFVDNGRALNHAKWVITSLFNGSLLPLALYPDRIEWTVRHSPFHLLMATPMELYLGVLPQSAFLPNLFMGIGWIIILAVIVALFWQTAERRFTSVGG
jgi:ABC-2 type transport system permease protein